MHKNKKLKSSIFIFRRDFRLYDNVGLNYALKNYNIVYPIFIFNDEQILKTKNSYHNNNSIQFMIESILDLIKDFKSFKKQLFIFKGNNIDIIKDICTKNNINDLIVNKDYTKYSSIRDNKIRELCKELDVNFFQLEDIPLLKEKQLERKFDDFNKKFTPFYKTHLNKKIEEVENLEKKYYENLSNEIKSNFKIFEGFDSLYEKNNNVIIKGGRKEAIKILNNLEKFKNYAIDRDSPFIKTTNLSSYLKFGCISIREVYFNFKKNENIKEDLIRQLYWRDFYFYIAYYYPKIFDGPLKDKYNNIKWENDENNFKKWINGETGYPIIDASMKYLKKSGMISNRMRMVVSNFLVKDLLIDWKWGEKYFAQILVDYDPCQNNGGWQWCSGSGTDSQPYFRIFNPMLQSKKIDPKAKFIKTHLPILKDIDPIHLHDWETHHKNYKNINYPNPMIIHKTRKEICIKAYKEGLGF